MNNSILFVDDEQNVLDGIRRQLRKQFNVDTALGPEEGLKRISNEVDYAIVVSDMRMPGMDGIAFLNRVEQAQPNTIRMMLTGNADQQTAIDAVNKGNIFRFLNKPCPLDRMVFNLEAGIRQYELVNAEKELLEKTLKGSIEALVDILALTNPTAFSRAERIRYYASQSIEVLQLHNAWKFEVAAMLSQIGYVTIPTEILEKSLAGEILTDEEHNMLANHAQEACQMIEKIPRLEEVSQMIALKSEIDDRNANGDPIILGAQLLRVVTAFDKLLSRGARTYQALTTMKESSVPYNSDMLNSLEHVQPPSLEKTICSIPISELRTGLVLAEDIRTGNNALIVSKGQIVSSLMRSRLENFLQQNAIGNKVRVYEERQVFTNGTKVNHG